VEQEATALQVLLGQLSFPGRRPCGTPASADHRLLRDVRRPRLLIVHGHSTDREPLKAYLTQTLQLPEPVLMIEEKMFGTTLPDKWEQVAKDVDGAIALVTPDDVGDRRMVPPRRRSRSSEPARTCGWRWLVLGAPGTRASAPAPARNTVVPSDLHGIDVTNYQEAPTEAAADLGAFVASLASKL